MTAKRGKRLNREVKCPSCTRVMVPLVLEFVPGRTHVGAHGFSMPDRNFLECTGCGSKFYLRVQEGSV